MAVDSITIQSAREGKRKKTYLCQFLLSCPIFAEREKQRLLKSERKKKLKLNFSTIAISLKDIGTEKEKKGGKLEIGFDRKKKEEKRSS